MQAHVMTTVRLPKTLHDKIKKHQEKLRDAQPGVRITLTDALRSLIERGLSKQ